MMVRLGRIKEAFYRGIIAEGILVIKQILINVFNLHTLHLQLLENSVISHVAKKPSKV